MGRDLLANIQVRDEDIVSNRGPRTVVTMLRVMAGLLLVVLVAQLTIDLLAGGPIALRVVLGDAVRLAIEALLLWAASEFAAMAIRSHDDLQATRILMARLIYRLAPPPDARRGDKTEAV